MGDRHGVEATHLFGRDGVHNLTNLLRELFPETVLPAKFEFFAVDQADEPAHGRFFFTLYSACFS